MCIRIIQWPAGHCSHAPPAAEYAPFSHSQLPVIGLGSVPFGQLRGTQSLGFVLPTALTVPRPHASQALSAVAPVPELNVLARHIRHAPREAWPTSGLYEPAGHWVHSDLPMKSVYLPSAHATDSEA